MKFLKTIRFLLFLLIFMHAIFADASMKASGRIISFHRDDPNGKTLGQKYILIDDNNHKSYVISFKRTSASDKIPKFDPTKYFDVTLEGKSEPYSVDIHKVTPVSLTSTNSIQPSVAVAGKATESPIALTQNSNSTVNNKSSLSKTSTVSTFATSSDIKKIGILNVIVNFSDKNSPCTKAGLDSTVFTSANSVSKAYKEASHGTIDMTGITLDPIAIDALSTDVCNEISWRSKVVTALAAKGIDYWAFAYPVLYIPANSKCAYTGVSIDDPTNGRFEVLNGSCAGSPIMHELGHSLNMGHANASNEGDYGDNSDFMGHGPVAHMNAPHKIMLKLAEPVPVQLGTFTVAPLESDPATIALPQVITYSKPNTNNYYYVSYRQPTGFDRVLGAMYLSGISIHDANLLYRSTYWRATLSDSGTFVDATNGLTFTQLNHDANGATFSISSSTCVRGPPKVSITSASKTIIANQPFSFSVKVANGDAGICPSSNYSSTVMNSAAFSPLSNLNYSPAILNLLPGAEGTITISGIGKNTGSSYNDTLAVTTADPSVPAHTLSSYYNIQYINPANCTVSAPSVNWSPTTARANPGDFVTFTLNISHNSSAGCPTPSPYNLSYQTPSGFFGLIRTNVAPAETYGFSMDSTTKSASLSYSIYIPPSASTGSYQLPISISDGLNTAASANPVIPLEVGGNNAPTISIDNISIIVNKN